MNCPDGGTCHHDCTRSCFRVRHTQPLSGVFPDDEWPRWSREPDSPSVRIPLTQEQVRLYHTSPMFKQGVDAFLAGVVPPFLEGLAQQAVREDQRVEAITRMYQRGEHPEGRL